MSNLSLNVKSRGGSPLISPDISSRVRGGNLDLSDLPEKTDALPSEKIGDFSGSSAILVYLGFSASFPLKSTTQEIPGRDIKCRRSHRRLRWTLLLRQSAALWSNHVHSLVAACSKDSTSARNQKERTKIKPQTRKQETQHRMKGKS